MRFLNGMTRGQANRRVRIATRHTTRLAVTLLGLLGPSHLLAERGGGNFGGIPRQRLCGLRHVACFLLAVAVATAVCG